MRPQSDRPAGLIFDKAHSADVTQRAMSPPLHIYKAAARAPLQKAKILLKKTALNPRHHLSKTSAFCKWTQKSSCLGDPGAHIFQIYSPPKGAAGIQHVTWWIQWLEKGVHLLSIRFQVFQDCVVGVTGQNPIFSSEATPCWRTFWAPKQQSTQEGWAGRLPGAVEETLTPTQSPEPLAGESDMEPWDLGMWGQPDTKVAKKSDIKKVQLCPTKRGLTFSSYIGLRREEKGKGIPA